MLITDCTDSTDSEEAVVFTEFLTSFLESRRVSKPWCRPESDLQVALLGWTGWPRSMPKHGLRAGLRPGFIEGISMTGL